MEETRPERKSPGIESGDQTGRKKLGAAILAAIPVLLKFLSARSHEASATAIGSTIMDVTDTWSYKMGTVPIDCDWI